MKSINLLMVLLMLACAEDSSKGVEPSDAGFTQADYEDASTSTNAMDMELVPPAIEDPISGAWIMNMNIVDVGGIVLRFRMDITLSEPRVIETLSIRVTDEDDNLSDELATLTELVIDESGQFEARFDDITLPGPFSPTGSNLVASLILDGEVRATNFMCGAVTGDVPVLGIELSTSTFGAVPLGEPESASCDEIPMMAPLPMVGPQDRPAPVFLPDTYEETEQDYPLILLLHGYAADGVRQDAYLGVSQQASELEFIMLRPEGSLDVLGNQFWSATPACCGDREVDDVAYLNSLIEATKSMYRVDEDRVYVIGHSNGGFMSYRLGCEIGDQLAGIVSIAGMTFQEEGDCSSPGKISIMHLHATDDQTVPFDGKPGARGYPSAQGGLARWAQRNECDEAVQVRDPVEMLSNIDGAETDVIEWLNCAQDTKLELYKHRGGGHIPGYGVKFTDVVMPWLLDQRRAE